MDQRVSGDESRRVGGGTSESSGDFVSGLELHNANGNGDVEMRTNELESCKVRVKVGEVVIDEHRQIGEASVQVGLIEGGSNSEDTLPLRGVNEELGAKFGDTTVEKSKKVVSEVEKSSCVIDVKSADGGKLGDNWDGERVCRICHLSPEQPLETSTCGHADTDLIHLGCGCKDELGIAHISCAEVWFKLKGNRMCEICGETATNIAGVGDNGFMEEWNEGRFVEGAGDPSNEGGGCWRGQPFCNFLMACLVIAFVLPWFFRVNMF